MLDWLVEADPFTHTIAALLLVGRVGDVVSTRLVTPTLRLEANAVARRLGWRFAWASLLLAAVPYFSLAVGIALTAASLLVAGSNLARGWATRALGEEEYEAFLLGLVARSRPASALSFLLGGAAFVVAAGLVLMWLSDSVAAPSYWFGVGIGMYGLALALHGSVFVLRLFRRARLRKTAVQVEPSALME